MRYSIPHVSIVLNNGCHGSEKAQQQRHWERRYVGVDLDNPRFDKLAEVYGARGFYVTRPQEIADAVTAALAATGRASSRSRCRNTSRRRRKRPGGAGH